MTLFEQHVAWMNRKKNPLAKKGNDTHPCEECGCEGDNTCGHECLDSENECTVDEFIVCPCCNVVLHGPEQPVVGDPFDICHACGDKLGSPVYNDGTDNDMRICKKCHDANTQAHARTLSPSHAAPGLASLTMTKDELCAVIEALSHSKGPLDWERRAYPLAERLNVILKSSFFPPNTEHHARTERT